MGNTQVDTAALDAAARQFATAAGLLDSAGRRVALRFQGSTAGRAHGVSGERLHSALSHLCAGVLEWSRAADEIAAGLRSGTEHYREAELSAAAALR